MNGVGVGLLLGVGLVLLLLAVTSSPSSRRGRSRVLVRIDAQLGEAGVPGVGASRMLLVCAAVGFTTAVVVAGVSRSPVLGLAFGAGAGYGPIALVRRRAAQRRHELRTVWPDVVDNLASAVRAGLTLPDALAQLASHASPAVADAFARFGSDYRASGRFGDALDQLKDRLSDPVADRIVESLRLAREVGGSDLGLLLRNLSAFLREDARTRGELEVRQGWTVNAAKLAAAAPWFTLVLLATRPEAVAAYNTVGGVVVLAGGAAVTLTAYRVMLRIGALPTEPRVLR